jgi:hypothetical protein
MSASQVILWALKSPILRQAGNLQLNPGNQPHSTGRFKIACSHMGIVYTMFHVCGTV